MINQEAVAKSVQRENLTAKEMGIMNEIMALDGSTVEAPSFINALPVKRRDSIGREVVWCAWIE
jgi:hypothetical protein